LRHQNSQAKSIAVDKATRLAVVFVAAAAAVLAWRSETFWAGDYPVEAGPAIDAIIHGRLHEFLESRPLMGPLSLILRAPFAALSLITGGGGRPDFYENAYRLGVFPCVVAAGIFGIFLARAGLRRGVPPYLAWGALGLIVVNPVSLKALTYGHPEEILCAALLAGAVLAAIEGRDGWAALLTIAALLTKQWAFLGVVPVAIAMNPKQVRKYALITAGVVVAAAVPLLVANASSFIDVNRHLLDTSTSGVTPTSAWWLAMPASSDGNPVTHETPSWLGVLGHPLLIVVCLVVAIALASRVRQDLVGRAFALLALMMLLRAMLDPVNNSYYHVPFFIALVAADALDRRYIPTLAALAGLIAIIDLSRWTTLQAVVYLAWAIGFSVYLAGRAYGLDWRGLIRSRGARGRGVAQPAHPSSSAASS
jgi:Glycosyltransferase family 87